MRRHAETQTSPWNAFASPRHAGGLEGSTPNFHQSAADLKREETYTRKKTIDSGKNVNCVMFCREIQFLIDFLQHIEVNTVQDTQKALKCISIQLLTAFPSRGAKMYIIIHNYSLDFYFVNLLWVL